jgi:hypothetical protein
VKGSKHFINNKIPLKFNQKTLEIFIRTHKLKWTNHFFNMKAFFPYFFSPWILSCEYSLNIQKNDHFYCIYLLLSSKIILWFARDNNPSFKIFTWLQSYATHKIISVLKTIWAYGLLRLERYYCVVFISS